jgi:hypothetical protein
MPDDGDPRPGAAPDPAGGPAEDRAPDTAGAEVRPLTHEELEVARLPHPRAPFEQVVRFAYTFDGYARFGMRLCGEMANRAASQFVAAGELPAWLRGDLDRLRACLFFEARRWILLEREPDTRALIYVHRLIEAIGDELPTDGAPPR